MPQTKSNFTDGWGPVSAAPVVRVTERAPTIRENVTVTSRESRTTFIGKDPATWTADDLRSYVVTQIEQRHGAWPRKAPQEVSIFTSYVNRYGEFAGRIAVYVFQDLKGYWRGAPVNHPNRFSKGSDEWFGDVIRERLTAE
jgi:hypothetical protein